ncbi:Rho GTPase-activating protein domain protein [Raphanus sativus]|nr:Rho GTPase-activating protein domain protein [Raphanus sativus]
MTRMLQPNRSPLTERCERWRSKPNAHHGGDAMPGAKGIFLFTDRKTGPTCIAKLSRTDGGCESPAVGRQRESRRRENSEAEYVREQLNKGMVPDGIDVHCLAELIKAWFRELPRGVLDPLPSEQVMQCESDDDFVKVVRLLPQTEASLLVTLL